MMHKAGFAYGDTVGLDLADAQVCVVCSAQDADHLARGVIESLVAQGHGEKVRLLCTWSESVQAAGFNLHCIVKQYFEPLGPAPTVFLVLSGFWREGSAVLSNLFRALSYTTPQRIVLAGPVMDAQAVSNMLEEMPLALRSSVQRLYCVLNENMTQAERERMLEVETSLYASMGFTPLNAANKYIPALVKERRRGPGLIV